jgi:alkylation response protein AidB-like acyl-CoA dehydrogenase
MDFSFTAEQEDLRRAVRDVADDRATSAQRRAALDTPAGQDAALWKVLTELGLPALGVPEPRGGAGASFVDAAVVLEEGGKALFAAPLLPGLVAGFAADDADLHAALVAGGVATVGAGAPGGPVRHVVDGAAADWVVLAGGDGLYVGSAADAQVVGQQTLDPTRRQATVTLPEQAARRVGDADRAERAVDLLRVALAVEAVGVARWCVEPTVDHLKTREQFERPIGSFQALQHRAADLLVMLEAAASAAYYAAWAAADSPAELPVMAPLALSVCADAAFRIAADTIQLHGGIGFTWEHDAHLYFKRATATRLLLGDTHEQRRLVAARSGLLA